MSRSEKAPILIIDLDNTISMCPVDLGGLLADNHRFWRGDEKEKQSVVIEFKAFLSRFTGGVAICSNNGFGNDIVEKFLKMVFGDDIFTLIKKENIHLGDGTDADKQERIKTIVKKLSGQEIDQLTKAQKQHVLFIDDTQRHCATAAQIGISAIHFPRGKPSEYLFQQIDAFLADPNSFVVDKSIVEIASSEKAFLGDAAAAAFGVASSPGRPAVQGLQKLGFGFKNNPLHQARMAKAAAEKASGLSSTSVAVTTAVRLPFAGLRLSAGPQSPATSLAARRQFKGVSLLPSNTQTCAGEAAAASRSPSTPGSDDLGSGSTTPVHS